MSGFNNYGYRRPDYQGPYIALRVKDQYGIEVFFSIKRSTKLKKLLNAYCDRQFADVNSTSFLFNGRSIRGEQTPHELQMIEGDKIHAILHRSEEHRVQYGQQIAINIFMEEEMIRLWKNSKENVVHILQSSEEMMNMFIDASNPAMKYQIKTLTKDKAPIVDNGAMDMFADASIHAMKYQSHTLTKDKAPILDNGAFFSRFGYQSILGTPMSGKKGGAAPPVGGTEDVVNTDTVAPPFKNSKRKKTVCFQAGPSKRTRDVKKVGQTEDVSGYKLLDDDSEDGLEKDGGSHSQSDGHCVSISSFIRKQFGDDKFVPSWVVGSNDACSDPLVCREPVGSVNPHAKDAILNIYQLFARMGSLLPRVMDKVQALKELKEQIEAFRKKSSILQPMINAGEADVHSLKDEMVGKVVKEPVRVVKKPVEHIMEKMKEKEVIEKPLKGAPSFMAKAVLMDKPVENVGEKVLKEKASEKVFQGGDTTAPLSDVPIGGRGDGDGAIGSSLGGGDEDPINFINMLKDADAGEGKDALP